MRRVNPVVACGFLVLLALGACSGGTASKEPIDIGGDVSNIPAFDVAVRDGAAFAIEQARSVRGFPLRFVPYDDSMQGVYSPDRGIEDVERMVADPRMLGMVGPLRDPVGRVEMPIANRAMLAMMSPTITEPCLTHPLDLCASMPNLEPAWLRPTGKNNYFHLAATDQLHGPAMAEFAYSRLGLRRIAIVAEADPYGMFASDNFAAAFTEAGGTVVARQDFDFTGGVAPDFRPWLVQAKAAGAEAIYAGGLFDKNALAPRLQSQGIFDPTSYYLGIDGLPDLFRYGIADDSSVTPGVMLNDHVYASRGIGAPYLNPEALGTIAAFVRAYPDPSENNSETFAGYDGAAILIDAIGRAIDANGGKMPNRQQVVDQLSKTTNFSGLTGSYTFTPRGDPTTSTLQILQYRAGGWTPITNIKVASESNN